MCGRAGGGCGVGGGVVVGVGICFVWIKYCYNILERLNNYNVDDYS